MIFFNTWKVTICATLFLCILTICIVRTQKSNALFFKGRTYNCNAQIRSRVQKASLCEAWMHTFNSKRKIVCVKCMGKKKKL